MSKHGKEPRPDEILKINMAVPSEMLNIYGFLSYRAILNSTLLPSVISGQELPEGVKCMCVMDKSGRKLVVADAKAEGTDILQAVNEEKADGIAYAVYDDLSRYATANDVSIYYYNIVPVCRMLKIGCPNITFADAVGGSVTYNDNDGNVTGIIVQNREFADGTMKEVFYELRHVWQRQYHKDWFDDYFYDPAGSEKFRMQKAELDADAFALALCHKMFAWRYTSPMTSFENVNKIITQQAKKIRLDMPEIGDLPDLSE